MLSNMRSGLISKDMIGHGADVLMVELDLRDLFQSFYNDSIKYLKGGSQVNGARHFLVVPS